MKRYCIEERKRSRGNNGRVRNGGRESERGDIAEVKRMWRRRKVEPHEREARTRMEEKGEWKCRESTVERRTRVRQLCGH